MHPLIWIFTAVAAAIGGGLLIWRRSVGRELGLMQAVGTSRVADLKGTAPGTLIELKGTIRADEPLISDIARVRCVHFRAVVEREVKRIRTGSDGKRETKREFETVSSNVRHARCALDDGSGSVPVDLDGATIEGEHVHNRYEAAESGGIGSLVTDLLDIGGSTLGHRYSEWALASEAQVYLLGTLLEDGSIGAARDAKHPFVVSIKSEEERTGSLTSTRRWLLVAAVVAFVVAAGLLVFGMR